MKAACVLCALLALTFTIRAQGKPPFADADVDQLIVLGRANKLNDLTSRCTAVKSAGFGGALGIAGAAIDAGRNRGTDKYVVTAMGPRGFVARGAWEATRAQKEFKTGDVPAAWREQALYVAIEPVFPKPDSKDEPAIPFNIVAVTIKTIPVRQSQPRIELKNTGELTSVNRTWKSAAGATVEYKETIARFDPAIAGRFEGDLVDVIVTTDGGNRACELTAGGISKYAKEGGKK